MKLAPCLILNVPWAVRSESHGAAALRPCVLREPKGWARGAGGKAQGLRSHEPDDAIRHEVGCWAHARRKLWEAAITKDGVARGRSRGSPGSSRSIARGESSPPSRSRRCARSTCARTPMRSSTGWRSSTSGSATSAGWLLRTALGYVCRQPYRDQNGSTQRIRSTRSFVDREKEQLRLVHRNDHTAICV